MFENCQGDEMVEMVTKSLKPFLTGESALVDMTSFQKNLMNTYDADIRRLTLGSSFSCTLDCAACSGRVAILGSGKQIEETVKPNQCLDNRGEV